MLLLNNFCPFLVAAIACAAATRAGAEIRNRFVLYFRNAVPARIPAAYTQKV